MIEIVMFTKNDCPNCMRAKMMFEHCPVNVNLNELNTTPLENGEARIDKNGDRYNSYEVQNLLKEKGIMSLPSFKINDEWIEGFNEGKIRTVLGL